MYVSKDINVIIMMSFRYACCLWEARGEVQHVWFYQEWMINAAVTNITIK